MSLLRCMTGVSAIGSVIFVSGSGETKPLRSGFDLLGRPFLRFGGEPVPSVPDAASGRDSSNRDSESAVFVSRFGRPLFGVSFPGTAAAGVSSVGSTDRAFFAGSRLN